MKIRRFIAFFLALFTIAAAFSCDTGKTSLNADLPSLSAEVITEDFSKREYAADNLPEGLDFDGAKLRVFYRNISMIQDFDLIGTMNTGEVVFDAVYDRNRAVEERLKISFEFIPSSGSSITDVKSQITKTVTAGSDDYDIIVATGNTLPQAGLNEYLFDLSDEKYLDFDQPWWWDDAMKELSVNINRRYYLIGDFLLYNLLSTGAVYFNKDIYRDVLGDPQNMYDTVLSGGWTLDKLADIIKISYRDVNGNLEADADDIYGMVTFSGSGAYHFQYATDVPSYTRGEDGYPVISQYNERSVSFVDKMIDIYNLTGTCTGLTEAEIITRFTENKTLFLPYRLVVSFNGGVRAMKTDFGVIPYPKLDERQTGYITMIHDCSSDAAVPLTNTNMEATTAALEALCSEAYRRVTEKFYDVALKTKYVRDDVSAQIIDLIRDSATKNFMAEYAALMNGIGHMLFGCVDKKSNTVASSYDKLIKAADKSLAALIKKQK